MKNIAILIPAYKPDNALINLCTALQSQNFYNIVVINDGSGNKYNAIFKHLLHLGITVITHKQNMGKGVALKTGFKFITSQQPHTTAIVTADADGQHLVNDIIKIAHQLLNTHNSLILGVREFNGKVPLRSKIGNTITKFVVSAIIQTKIIDSQTGLRGIPVDYAKKLIHLYGKKYEFELNMLLNVKKYKFKIKQTPIQTVYINNNQSSHFNPLQDSIKIYATILKYLISAGSSFLLDYFLFVTMLLLTQNTKLSFAVSRSISVMYNFYINKKVVFASNKNSLLSLIQYLTLAFANFIVVLILLETLKNTFNVYWLKIMLDLLAFVVNFYIQKYLVFSNKK